MYSLSLIGTNGQLYMYDDHLVIERKGFVAKYTHLNNPQTVIYYTDIDRVKMHLGTIAYSGYFYFCRKGSNKNIGLFASGTDEDSLAFRYYRNDEAKRIWKYVNTMINRVL